MKTSTLIVVLVLIIVTMLLSYSVIRPETTATPLTSTTSQTALTIIPVETIDLEPANFSYSEGLIASKFNINKYVEELKKLESFKVKPRKWFRLPLELTPKLINQLKLLIKDENVNINKLISMLKNNGFVVIPSRCIDLIECYKKATLSRVITVDSVLFVYHVLFDNLLAEIEEKYLYRYLCDFVKLMLKSMEEDYENLPKGLRNGIVGRALEYNMAYFSLLAKLLDVQVEIPYRIKGLVESEFRKVVSASGILVSSLFNYEEDYTQYKPRGHYTKTDLHRKYFKAMMYMGRMTFNIKPRYSQKEDDVKRLTIQALIIVKNMFKEINGIRPYDLWEKIYTVTAFLVGKADDLTPLDYMELARKVYGEPITYDKLINETLLKTFMDDVISYAEKVSKPRIISHPIFPSERPSLIGMRVMGQRFIIDGYIHQLLIFSNVPGRFIAKALDIPAAMDSKRAWELLENERKIYGDPYERQMMFARSFVKNMTLTEWLSTTYNAWLYTLRSLLNLEHEEYFPSLMKNEPYVDKSLNTFLASWAQLRHDTILYAKQPYTEKRIILAKSGWVEPLPKTYARLLILAKMTRDGLRNLGLLDKVWRKRLDNLVNLTYKLYTISLKEIEGRKLNEDELRLIRAYHYYLESIIGGLEADPRIVADVQTDSNSERVVEVATGYFYKIIMVYPLDNELALGVGFTLSFYEFVQPMDNRLTDEEWRKIVDYYQPPQWTNSFMLNILEPKQQIITSLSLLSMNYRR